MNPDDTATALTTSMDAQVRRLYPHADPDALFARIERRVSRERRFLLLGLVLALAVAGSLGYLIGRDGTTTTGTPVAVQDGAPGQPSADLPLEPANVPAARAAVIEAFEHAYSGGTPPDVRRESVQNADQLEPLTARVRQFAERYGYTPEQLAGASIKVSDVRFIDAEHAVVVFTISVPGHGDTLVDRVGYAVYSQGRWKVSLRTACDLLSLGGGGPCPPAG
ncbi:MAG TPA: hypothetical protein VEP49_15510 [Acidimicrobiia bacterium]|nr:hypothetical protein [Acidimicrobiia bacterium]